MNEIFFGRILYDKKQRHEADRYPAYGILYLGPTHLTIQNFYPPTLNPIQTSGNTPPI